MEEQETPQPVDTPQDEFESFDEVDASTVELPDDSFDESVANFDLEGDDH